MQNQTKERLYREMQAHVRWSEYQSWLADNQPIIRELVARARQVKSSGLSSYSIRALWEVARYELQVIRADDSEYTLDNNFCPLVARTVLILAPDLGPEFFRFRSIKTTPDAIVNHRENKS